MSGANKIKTKYIVVTGGVLSGLGKGVAAASIGRLLCSRLKIVPVKLDGYLNTDPGTMNPVEHGEVFVLDDGGEVDMDFGHYERFLTIQGKFGWNLTMGKVFQEILERERRGDFLGKTVQFIPHATNVIKERIYGIGREENADILLIEVGGTVGDLENLFYIEAVRQMRHEVGQENMLFVHLTYVPVPSGVREQKSKPTQQGVKLLNEFGIYPDVVIGRCQEYLDDHIKEKIALFGNVQKECVISGPDVESVYEIPLVYEKEGLSALIHKKLGIYSPPALGEWSQWVSAVKRNNTNPEKVLEIALGGKYTALEDSYASLVESLEHAGAHLGAKVQLRWIETSEIEKGTQTVADALHGVDGLIIPGGFGARGIEGKIQLIRHARENNLPFLGICYGMQLAVVEYARNVCGMEGAHTEEVENPEHPIPHKVICYLPGQKNLTKKGGTMRLGGHDVEIKKDSRAFKIYGNSVRIRERFRHRYEVNPEYVAQLEAAGLIFSGKAPGTPIMQVVELPEHPYFMACQFHPELKSNLLEPAPLFFGLVQAALSRRNVA
ncbi:MAG TPA: CTP synthase (glutamine hydrolyzing) [Fibrobacteria bacterium]|nr:CTP synthase (glutamine hydrolyzing) [Fibrobacteria bacterium]